MLNFIYGFLAASLISAIALVCYDCHESDFAFYLAGGPVLWVIGLFCWVYQAISRKAIYSNCRSVFEAVTASFLILFWNILINTTNPTL